MSLSKRQKTRAKYIQHIAPPDFSLIDNAEAILGYFQEAHEYLRAGRRINFDLSRVARVSPDAIALLIANVESDEFRCGVDISGTTPTEDAAARMFSESGFFSHVKVNGSFQSNKKNLLLHKVTKNKVENTLAKRAGELAVEHLYNDGRRIRPLYEVLIECMANTNNHADPQRKGFYDWWLFLYCDPDESRASFTFLDLGVGVFKSLPVMNFLKDPLRAVGLRGNLSLLPKLFAGEISSRTRMAERGKGIPRIHEHATGGAFTKFTMIANDVYADLINEEYRYLRKTFGGTFFCFELKAADGRANYEHAN